MTLIKAETHDHRESGSTPPIRARLAQSADEVRKAQQLRFEVFNLELGEGLAASHALERDVDAFDEVCDHLIVEESRERGNGRHLPTADRPIGGGKSRILQRTRI